MRFGNGAIAAEMTAGESSSVVVMATAAPRVPVTASLRAAAEDVDGARRIRHAAAAAATTKSRTAAPIVAQASDANSKGRWTLIWMGSAIAAVAGLMSLC